MPDTRLEFRRRPPMPARLLRRQACTLAPGVAMLPGVVALHAFVGDAYRIGSATGFGLAVLLQRVRKLRMAAPGGPVAVEFLGWSHGAHAVCATGLDARSAHHGMVE